MIEAVFGTTERIIEIETLIYKQGARQRIIQKYKEQVEATNDLTEEQAGHLGELEQDVRNGFWEIVEKCAVLKDALKTEIPF